MACGCNKSVKKTSSASTRKIQPTRSRIDRTVLPKKNNNGSKIIRRVLDRY